MKKARIVLLLSLLPVLALVVYVAYAATVICSAAACSGTVNADTILAQPAAVTNITDLAGNDVIYLTSNFAHTVPCAGAGDCDGNDIIIGGPGGETIGSGLNETGNDKIFGNGGNDTVRAGPGDDYIDCGPGTDNCDGDDGNDIIIGGQGQDNFAGANNGGDDVFIIFLGDSGGATEAIDCGGGTDVVIFVGFGNRIFTSPVADSPSGAFNIASNCEILIGG
jgi:hypothetical protein